MFCFASIVYCIYKLVEVVMAKAVKVFKRGDSVVVSGFSGNAVSSESEDGSVRVSVVLADGSKFWCVLPLEFVQPAVAEES